jgi:hypothetical protein
MLPDLKTKYIMEEVRLYYYKKSSRRRNDGNAVVSVQCACFNVENALLAIGICNRCCGSAGSKNKEPSFKLSTTKK